VKPAREYVSGPVPTDICLKRVPSLGLIDALIARSVAVSESDPDTRVLSRDDERPLIHKPLAVRYSGKHPESSADRTVVRFVVSSGEEARDDKDLLIEGIDFTGYDLNPVWLFAHDWEGLPIGRCLARRTYKRGSTYELWKDIEFTPEDLYPFGYQVGQMHARGFLRACSGGWMGTRIRVVRGASGQPERIQYLASDWMETSSCAVGIDKYAVQEAVARGVLKPDGVDQFARAARIAATGVAYEVRSMDRTEGAERAFKPNEKRTLVEEHVMDHNPIGEWKQQALRALGGDTPETPEVAEPTPSDAPVETPVETPVEPEATPVEPEPEAAPVETPPSGEPTDDDATTVRAALGMLRRFVAANGDNVALRGPVSQAVDSAVDALYANVMVLAQCAEELRGSASSVFYEGRSADDARRVVRARMDALAERMSLLAADPSAVAMTDAYLERAVVRAESALARSGNALSELRDAVSLYGDAEGGVETVVRAGKKISAARRERLSGAQEKLAAAVDTLQTAITTLQAVLDEDPPAKKDDEDEEVEPKDGEEITPEEAEAADEAVGRAALDQLLTRAARLLDQRIAEPIAAKATAIEARFAEIAKRSSAVVASGDTEAVVAPPDDAAAKRVEAIAQRAARFKIPGVLLPEHARVRS